MKSMTTTDDSSRQFNGLGWLKSGTQKNLGKTVRKVIIGTIRAMPAERSAPPAGTTTASAHFTRWFIPRIMCFLPIHLLAIPFKRPCAWTLWLALQLPLAGQSTISPVERHAHAANAGWIDWRPSPADGVVCSETHLSGHAWSGNFGWILFGNGQPANGHRWSNTTADDFGVNLEPAGQLTGYAWAPNIGWIVFESTYGNPKLDYLTGRLSGHVWASNIGWIQLETPTSALGTLSISRPDSDGDGIPDAYESLHFNSLKTAGPGTDADGDGVSDLEESIADTDPNDPADRLRIVDHSYPDGFTKALLTFTSRPSRLYRIETTTDLQPPWTLADPGTFPPDAGPTTSRLFKIDKDPRRFFRVLAMRPLQP